MLVAVLRVLLFRIGYLFPWLMKGSYLYLMFPSCRDNDETRRYLKIAQAAAMYKPIILFTDLMENMADPKNKALQAEFKKCGIVVSMLISRSFRARCMKIFHLGALSSALNGSESTVVLGMDSVNFYNDILHHARPGLRAWNILPTKYPLACIWQIPKLAGSLVIGEENIEDVKFMYELGNAEDKYFSHVYLVQRIEDAEPLLKEILAK